MHAAALTVFTFSLLMKLRQMSGAILLSGSTPDIGMKKKNFDRKRYCDAAQNLSRALRPQILLSSQEKNRAFRYAFEVTCRILIAK